MAESKKKSFVAAASKVASGSKKNGFKCAESKVFDIRKELMARDIHMTIVQKTSEKAA